MPADKPSESQNDEASHDDSGWARRADIEFHEADRWILCGKWPSVKNHTTRHSWPKYTQIGHVIEPAIASI